MFYDVVLGYIRLQCYISTDNLQIYRLGYDIRRSVATQWISINKKTDVTQYTSLIG